MSRKIVKIVWCILLWFDQVSHWLHIFETWPLFNRVTNENVVLVLSMLFAIASTIGIIQIVLWAWNARK